jgi:histidyl-tRNA synthetase
VSARTSEAPRSVKGTRDLLPPETAIWAAVEQIARDVFSLYGFGEIRTPILEETELFVRGVGAGTDIVGKEMYTFLDKGGRSVSLRPESTAAVARAYVQHRLSEWPEPVKLFYVGPHFRYERPQRGRYRQFHQIGAEILGDPGPWSDAELLLMLVRFLRRLGFSDLVVRLNTVGDVASRSAFATALRSYLEPHRDELGEDSKRRFETNPLRILDTKLEHERALLERAPKLAEHLSGESREHFDAVRGVLDRHGVPYEVDERLVRGLDYYTRTVFEIAAEGLGAQDAILGGGRYDGLIAELGGPSVPGIGFAIGEDRLIEVLPAQWAAAFRAAPPHTIVTLGAAGPAEALSLAEELHDAGVAVVAELSGSMRAGLKRAGRRGSAAVLIVGDDELAAGEVTVKDYSSGTQERIPRERVGAFLEDIARRSDRTGPEGAQG